MKREKLNFNRDLAHFTPRQKEAIRTLEGGLVKFLLYGGALGGGKSYFLRWYCVKRLMQLFVQGITGAIAMLACEDYLSLKDRQLSKIGREFPEWLGRMHQDHKEYGRCFILSPEYGGGIICFRNLDDPSKYASAEFCLICVDELTKNEYDVFTFLRTRLRWPGLEDIECQFVAGTNPGGIGHGWVKQLWMDKQFPEEWIKPVDYRSQFAYIPSKADDNPNLPASYWAQLETLPPTLRKAFRDGDWNIFMGQAFPEFGPAHKVPDDTPISQLSPIYMTFDWGFGHPFSIGWHWLDADGRIYRFAEWYGSTGEPNKGLRLTDSEIAEGIKEREGRMKITERQIVRILSPDCFSKKPDYKGGGQGKATAEVFREHGLVGYPGDADRVKKVRQFHERLRVIDGQPPMLQVYERCKDFIRTIPMLQQDELNIEDIDCFTAGTMIATPDGNVPIEDIKVGDLVNTPIGPRSVLKSGMAGHDQTSKVFFDDGTFLEATNDHKIYVDSYGLLPVCRLSSGHAILTQEDSCLSNLSSFPESNLQSVTVEDISNVIQAMQNCLEQPFSIELFGSLAEGKFPMDTASTIKTTIPQITALKIWNSYLRQTMQDTISKKELNPVAISDELLIIGEQASKERKFFGKTLVSAVKNLPCENLRALIVANLLSQSIHERQPALNHAKNLTQEISKSVRFAESNSKQNPIAPKRLRPVVTHVVGSSERKPVYYLTVDQAHLFFANNILTANTDGEDHCFDDVCFLFLARPLGQKKTDEKPKKPPQNISEVAARELEQIRREYEVGREMEMDF